MEFNAKIKDSEIKKCRGRKREKVLVMDIFLNCEETLYDSIEDFADKTGIDIAACRSAKSSGGLLKKRYYID
jgi:hypothetical protein